MNTNNKCLIHSILTSASDWHSLYSESLMFEPSPDYKLGVFFVLHTNTEAHKEYKN